MSTPTRYYGNVDAAIEYERSVKPCMLDGTIKRNEAIINEIKQQYEQEINAKETKRLQSIIDGFRLSKVKGVGGNDL